MALTDDLLIPLARLRVAHGAPPTMSDPDFLATLMPPPAPTGTVRVRIAVAVGPDGDWEASGYVGATDKDLRDTIGDGLDCEVGEERVSWVTALVPLPEPAAEVVGEVSGG